MFKIPDGSKTIVSIVCVIAIALSIYFIFKSSRTPERPDRKWFADIGSVIAERLAKELPGDANIAVLTVALEGRPNYEEQIELFMEQLGNNNVEVVDQEEIRYTMSEMESALMSAEHNSLPRYLEFAKQHAEADYVVIYGAPLPIQPRATRAPAGLPAIIFLVTDYWGLDPVDIDALAPLLHAGVVEWALAPIGWDAEREIPLSQAESAAEWLDRHFETYIPAKAGSK